MVFSLSDVVLPIQHNEIIIETPNGKLAGKRGLYNYSLGEDNVTNVVDTFLGVPFAAPPVNDLRFEPPQDPEPWSGVRSAIKHGWVCPQMEVYHPGTNVTFQNEDCLYLDVYTPFQRDKPNVTYPVMVYIHGGSYEVGSGKLYNGQVLAHFGVVVVTFNYRLGALGFLTSGTEELPGNYGLLDQIHALKWVRKNIRHFRGDPGRVTIFGHSAGGASVGILLTAPSAKGLFQAAIAQSGSATASYSYHAETKFFPEYIKRVGHLMGCPSKRISDIVTCLKKSPATQFITSRVWFPLFDPIDPEFRPIVDGKVLPRPPSEAIRDGNFTKVPFILGTVRDEFDNYFNGGARHRPVFDSALDKYVNKSTGNDQVLADIVRYEYTDWLGSGYFHRQTERYDRGALLSDMHMVAPTAEMCRLLSSHGVPTYQYHFTAPYSYHSVELNYVFGAPFSGIYADEMNPVLLFGWQNFTMTDQFYSRLVMKIWTNLAKFGHPTPTKLGPINIDWTPYTNTSKEYLYLSSEGAIGIKQNFRADKVAFWNGLIPRLKRKKTPSAFQQQETGTNYETEMWVFLGISIVLLVGLVILLYLFIKTRMKQIAQQAKYGVKYIDNGRGPTGV